MQTMSFFDSNCSENSRTDSLFGLVDPSENKDSNKRTFSTTESSETWNAKVINTDQLDVTFHAIDHCVEIFKDNSNDQESLCDGVLTFNESLYLVELKRKNKDFIPEAKLQLENTIRLLVISGGIDKYKSKKAFISNSKHPHFRVIRSSEQKEFYDKNYGFRLDINYTIILK
jgi:hypothetical protein